MDAAVLVYFDVRPFHGFLAVLAHLNVRLKYVAGLVSPGSRRCLAVGAERAKAVICSFIVPFQPTIFCILYFSTTRAGF